LPSASISIEIIANYLRMHNFSVALIEPTFENLASILKRQGITLQAVKEQDLLEGCILKWLEMVEADALFLTIPNNPTGYTFSVEDFNRIVQFCIQRQKLLILDFSFRFFSPSLRMWDQYDVLDSSGVHYIAIGDTGKIWPSFGVKVSPITADQSVFQLIKSLYEDLLVCSSPLALVLLTEFIQLSTHYGVEKTVLTVADRNRQALQEIQVDLLLQYANIADCGVAWLKILDECSWDDLELQKQLEQCNIGILPGRLFFWSNPYASSRFIRVALLRDPHIFQQGMSHLKQVFPLLRETSLSADKKEEEL